MNYGPLGRPESRSVPIGAMMFGAVGNPDHEECIRTIHQALEWAA